MRGTTLLLALAALLFVAPARAPAQDGGEAKKLFDAMEEKLTKAKSLRLAFTSEMTKGGAERTDKIKGTLTLGQGDRFRLEAAGSVDGKDIKVVAVSDGKMTGLKRTRGGEPSPDVKKAPTRKNIAAGLARTVSRSGVFLGLSGPSLDPARKGDVELDKLFPVSDFKLGGKEKVEGREAQVLTYKLSTRGDEKLNVKVWIDPATSLPLKRVVTVPSKGGAEGRMVETYADIKTSAELDAKSFELPK
jgi:outer membrane lipoprotein-sorting protein